MWLYVNVYEKSSRSWEQFLPNRKFEWITILDIPHLRV